MPGRIASLTDRRPDPPRQPGAPGQLLAPHPTTTPARPRPFWGRVLAVGLLAAAYYGAAKLGLSAGALKGNVTPVWPPTGLAIAALIIFGRRLWPGVALGALAVNGLSSVPLAAACGMAAGNTLEALAGAYLVRRIAGSQPAMSRVRDVVAMVLGAALLSTTVSASVGVTSLALGGVLPAAAIWETWRTWWVGDALGALVVAPMLLAWLVPGTRTSRPERIEGVVVMVAAAAVTTIVFLSRYDYAYLIFPVLIWAALRVRQRGATMATLVMAAIAVVSTAAGRGPFASASPTHDLWILATFLAVVSVTGMVLAAVVSERDLATHEARSLSRQLQQRVVDLQDANRELEAFTYTVSHDLRAPLRNIDGFSRNLMKRSAGALDPESERYLGVIRRNAKAMGTLIDELLAFSRLQRQELRTEPVDLRDVVDDALVTLSSERADRPVEIVIGDLPTCDIDRALLSQVYVNLLANALKFTRARTPARIEIGSETVAGQPPTMFVRDNGVGFDMSYADKLFGVFQRLHRQEDYEGSGVGLAIVQRIVSRHGGTVWAEGAVDAGATVFFTLGGAAHGPAH